MNMCRAFALAAAVLLGLLGGCKPMFPTDAEIAAQCREYFEARGGNADAVDKCIETARFHRDREIGLWLFKHGHRY